jgi:hypothetical protein
MAWKLIASGAVFLCLAGPAFADEVIFNGKPCNSLCQWWMGIGPAQDRETRKCQQIVSHSARYDADLVQLCHFVARKRDR